MDCTGRPGQDAASFMAGVTGENKYLGRSVFAHLGALIALFNARQRENPNRVVSCAKKLSLAAQQLESSYVTPVWVEVVAHQPCTYAGIISEEVSRGSVVKARRYARKIEELCISFHNSTNRHYYAIIEREGESEVFRVYAISRSNHTNYPIFQGPLHQAVLRDFYILFRLCGHNMRTLAAYLEENNNQLPPTGLPLSPETLAFRNHESAELQPLRQSYFGQV